MGMKPSLSKHQGAQDSGAIVSEEDAPGGLDGEEINLPESLREEKLV